MATSTKMRNTHARMRIGMRCKERPFERSRFSDEWTSYILMQGSTNIHTTMKEGWDGKQKG